MDLLNSLLASHELEFVDDGHEHDGYVVVSLERTNGSGIDYTR